MTFSQSVKEEILLNDILPECAKLEVIAALKSCGSLIQDYSGYSIEIRTSQIKLAKRILEILHHEYPNAKTQTMIRTTNKFKKRNNEYILVIQTDVKEILLDLELINEEDNFIYKFNETNFSKFPKKALQYYVMIFFGSSGSINDPRKSGQYHLEITCQNGEYLEEIIEMTKEFDINFKITKRKTSQSLYLNKAEEIADFLKFILAVDTLFEFEDFRLIRDMTLMNNRLNNADIANETKKYSAINKQIDAINKLIQTNEYKDLTDKQKQVAQLRLDYPEDSLNELALRTEGLISKSNISHHLRNIVAKVNDDL